MTRLSSLMLAAAVGVGLVGQSVTQAQSQTATANAMQVPVTHVMVLLTAKPGVPRDEVMKVLPQEVRETVKVYLDGRIDQWYSRGDGKGVVFFLRCTTVEEAEKIMGGLPLDKAGLVNLEFIPVGPLAPLRFLVKTDAAGGSAEK